MTAVEVDIHMTPHVLCPTIHIGANPVLSWIKTVMR
jgi:hypothetical protein